MNYVKICGLKNIADIQLSISSGANAVGFIYNVPNSPRNLEESEITKLLNKIPKEVKTILVFKPKDTSEVIETMKKIETDFYQLHCKFNIGSLEKLSKEIIKKQNIG